MSITIALTDRPPVEVDGADWPRIAQGHWGDNAPNPPDREWTIRVRRHADGRTIVYGTHSSCYQDEDPYLYGGIVLDSPDQTVYAIREIGEQIAAPPRVVAEAIADLPVERL